MKKTIIIGNGNLGFHLADLFKNVGIEFLHFSYRDFHQIDQLTFDDSFVWLCISDELLPSTIYNFQSANCNVISSSGGLNIEESWKSYCCVWYPLYSFKKDQSVDWSVVPLFTEYFTPEQGEYFNDISNRTRISGKPCNTKLRLKLHLAAVFVNNFGNALLNAVENINPEMNHDELVEALFPIGIQTIERWKNNTATELQTGPAMRGDGLILRKHLEELKDFQQEEIVYRILSDYISQNIKQKIPQKVKK